VAESEERVVRAPNPNPETREVNLFDSQLASCPQPIYARMHAQCPVARAALIGSPVISRYEDVIWALRHPEIFSSEMEVQMQLGTERPMIPQQVDPPAQTRYRKLLDPHFSRKKVAELEPDVRRYANDLIDRFVGAGSCNFDPDFAIPLPCTVFLRLMGLPRADLDSFLELKDGIIRPQVVAKTRDVEEMRRVRVESGKKIYAYFEQVLDDRSARPRDDLLTRLVRSEIEGERLTRDELLDICFLLVLAGLDTITGSVGCSIAYLATNADKRRRLVEDPKLIPAAVEELLRWETPVTAVPRLAKRTVKLGGMEIQEGELVTLLLGAADVDEEEFPNAREVDFERRSNRHLAFGGGPHRCQGSHLARLELRVAMEEWHRRIPEYEIAPGESPRYSPGIRGVTYLPLVWAS
jgi:cytochrome P450